MFRVIIVDDERYIISLIEKLVDWKSLNLKVVATALNGVDALNLAKLYSPDIMIIDVKIPGYNGIQLIQEIRKYNKTIKFIMISGHKKFEFAQSAIKYGIEDYLVKPLSKNELETILFKTTQSLNQKALQEVQMQEKSEQLGRSTKKIHHQFLDDVLSSSSVFKSLEQINEQYLTAFATNKIQTIAIQLVSTVEQPNILFLDRIFSSIEEKITSFLIPAYGIFVQEEFMLLCLFSAEHNNVNKNNVQQLYNLTNEIIAPYHSIQCIFGVGIVSSTLVNLKDSIQSAKDAVCTRFDQNNSIIFGQELSIDETIINTIVNGERKKSIRDSLSLLDFNQLNNQIEQIYKTQEGYTFCNSAITKEIIFVLFSEIKSQLIILGVKNNDLTMLETNTMSFFYTATNRQHLFHLVFTNITQWLESYYKPSKMRYSAPISISLKYIQNNYQSEISLSEIGHIVHLNPIYFSQLFKKEVGINFVDYLNKYRLDMSKKMLLDLNYTIYQIADLCGFSNSQYFSRLFKKNIGISPTQYRDRQIERAEII